MRQWEHDLRARYGSAIRTFTAHYQNSPSGRYHCHIYVHISPTSPRRTALCNLDNTGRLAYCQLVRSIRAYARYIARDVDDDDDDEPGSGEFNTTEQQLQNGSITNPDGANQHTRSMPAPPSHPDDPTPTRQLEMHEKLRRDVLFNELNWSQTMSKYYNWPHASRAYHAIKQGLVEPMERDISLLVIKGVTGIGKTTQVHNTLMQLDLQWYDPGSQDPKWWDGYDYEDIVLCDEFTAGPEWQVGYINRLTNRMPLHTPSPQSSHYHH